MRTIFISVIVLVLAFWGCKSGNTVSKAEALAELTGKVDSMNYTFVPQSMNPLRGQSRSISYSYFLKVRQDTVSAYLPFFGRAYTAPLTGDGGINFDSTDFEYSVSEKKKGEWDVKIKINDDRRGYELSLQIGDSGYGYLSVRDNTRDPISFYGKIE